MEISKFLLLINYFQDILQSAQEHRAERNHFIENELGWITFERKIMFNAVNDKRLEFNLSPLTLDQFRKAENSAVGHTDYTHKFALYCAELIKSITPPTRGGACS